MTTTETTTTTGTAEWPTGTMTAAALRRVGDVGLVEIPVPEPLPGTALVEPVLVGLCGTDLELLHGSAAYVRDGRVRWPHVFGHEWVGRVVALAPGTSAHVAEGDRVVGHTMISCGVCRACRSGGRNNCSRLTEVGLYGQQGAAARYIRMPVHALSAVPDAVPDTEAALVEPTVTVIAGLEAVRCGPGDRVLVLGTGTIGLLATQLATRLSGAVDVVAVDPAGAELALGLGARRALAPDDTPPGAYDVVVEASGADAAFLQSLRAAAVGGRIAAIGVPSTSVGPLDACDLVLRGISVHGVRHGLDHYDRALALYASGALSARGMTNPPLPLDRVADAFADLARASRPAPKVVLAPQG
ncbi:MULTISPECIES: alcohol dehydrogenase catalytic domain-containing protein [Actinosynnema]|uniref:zinc-dependent alcohol dehydrogenase n=1 Tax=Actinosynnema TaxID=40566 RepID=UPI0020A4F5B7|nr:alcohol dehydrogenase catalytic domain-containing protein [Actinosynnema pretiosum]MCP2094790.1 Threonine dehydrogenase [Actinosynnema pretiosum]